MTHENTVKEKERENNHRKRATANSSAEKREIDFTLGNGEKVTLVKTP